MLISMVMVLSPDRWPDSGIQLNGGQLRRSRSEIVDMVVVVRECKIGVTAAETLIGCVILSGLYPLCSYADATFLRRIPVASMVGVSAAHRREIRHEGTTRSNQPENPENPHIPR